MNPDEFLDLAIKLSNGPSEAERRTAVSRAYYGIFHLAHKLVTMCGVRLAVNEAHAKLCHCLKSGCKNSDAQSAGSKLDTLRESRRRSDYELGDGNCKNARWVQLQIGLARQAADALALCSRDPVFAEISAEIREYAKSVRLQVREP
jgi:hypothetical protein